MERITHSHYDCVSGCDGLESSSILEFWQWAFGAALDEESTLIHPRPVSALCHIYICEFVCSGCVSDELSSSKVIPFRHSHVDPGRQVDRATTQ
jgi:hypothetical protein